MTFVETYLLRYVKELQIRSECRVIESMSRLGLKVLLAFQKLNVMSNIRQ